MHMWHVQRNVIFVFMSVCWKFKFDKKSCGVAIKNKVKTFHFKTFKNKTNSEM